MARQTRARQALKGVDVHYLGSDSGRALHPEVFLAAGIKTVGRRHESSCSPQAPPSHGPTSESP